MFRSYRVGRLLGFPIEMNLSFLFILALVLLTTGLVSGLLLATVLFGSVLLHELGHAVVARYLGVEIGGIELHFFGGAAKMTSMPRTANDEVAIAAAGPAVSFALGGLGLILAAITGLGAFTLIGWINLILGAFNLVPALPMDGGRILRALLTRKYSFVQATDISIKITKGFAIALGVLGIYIGSWYLPLLAILLWFMGTRELKMAHMMSVMFGYDRNGYCMRDEHWRDQVEVLPADYLPRAAQKRRQQAANPFFSRRRTAVGGGFVIRQRDGRWYIETFH